MLQKIFIFLLCLLLPGCRIAIAQTSPVEADSSKLYRNIEKYSKKSKFTDAIYGIFFRRTADHRIQKKILKKKIIKQKPYSAFECKIIREINITTLDPFGYSIKDTSVIFQNFLFRAGNAMHVKSHRISIRNLLLIHKNDLFDSLLVKESERLIRTQKFVHDVAFTVSNTGENSDSVDIYIREMDRWSIVPAGSISTSGMHLVITDKNFLGSGHEFKNSFSRNFTTAINAFSTTYSIPNIKNTYISSTLHYELDGYNNFQRSLAFDRPFYSPFAKWAAGVAFVAQLNKDSVVGINGTLVPLTLHFGTQDYWAGYEHPLYKGNSEEKRVTNIVLTGRYFRIHYLEQAYELYDSLQTFSNEDFYLGGIGISTRKYVQDQYVFKYGVTEDVPVGKVYGLTGGYQVKNNTGRLYLGMRFSFGNYNTWGYLSSNVEYGTFYRASHQEQSVVSIGFNYFTYLFEIGTWKFRQFVKPQFIIGFNRLASEQISINNENGIRGFNSPTLVGTRKIVVTLQTQSYAPWNVLGFRFGPYLIYSLGMLGTEDSGFKRSRVYSQFSLGLLIKNEYLVFSIFQLSLAFYPIIPDEGHNIFKMNSNTTGDFGFRDFNIGKPGTVAYE